jgi:exosortase
MPVNRVERTTPEGVRPAAQPAGGVWSAATLLLTAAGLLIALFGERFYELSRLWCADANYSHGFLVPLVSGYFAWWHFRAAGWPRDSAVAPALVWLVGGCLFHLAAVVVWLPPLDFVALAAVLHGLALLAGGRVWARGLTFPILFLFFMFPLPAALADRAALWLQGVVSTLGTSLLQFFVPAHQEGNWIELPGQRLEVGEACSGLRQVVAFVALALVVAHVSRRSWPFKVGLLLSAVPAAVAANLLRVLLMALVLCRLGPDWISAETVIPVLGLDLHSAWGLLTMAAGLGLLLAAAWWLGRLLPEEELQIADCRLQIDQSAICNLQSAIAKRLSLGVTCLGVALAAQVALLAYLRGETLPPFPELQQPLTSVPVSLGAWHGRDIPASTLPSSARTYFDGADDRLYRDYVLGEGPSEGLACQLWAVHFRSGEDRQHHPLICYQVAGYAEDRSGWADVTVDGEASPVKRFCFTRNGRRSYVFYWHYTLETPDEETSALRLLHQRRTRRLPSLTVEVTTTAQAPEQLAAAAGFVRQVARACRALLPPQARMGSDTVPVRLIAPPKKY